MDKIPKLRRKPKPPTIETTVERPSTATSDHNYNNNAAAADNHRSPSGSRHPSSDWFKRQGSSSARKKSPFRLIRTSGKRARESSPAGSSTASVGSPSLQVPGQGGAKFPRNNRTSRQSALPVDDETSSVDGVAVYPDRGPQMPAFLTLSNTRALAKFHLQTRYRPILTLPG